MLFVTHHARESQPKLGLPIFLDRTFTENFNEKKPMEGIYSSDRHRQAQSISSVSTCP